MNYEVVGIGPSLVDVSAQLSDEAYRRCCEVLQTEPGGWHQISTRQELQGLMSIIGESGFSLNTEELASVKQSALAINAGSSILGMMSAMPLCLRSRSIMVSAVAQNNGLADPLSEVFSKAVATIGIGHEAYMVEGHNPVGFVLSGESNSEKTLAMYPGVADEIDEIEELRSELTIIDAYELRGEVLGRVLVDLVESRRHKIGLSLGNHMILCNGLRDKIRSMIDGGLIHALCGNQEEYISLYPEVEPQLATKEYFKDHPVLERVPYAVMTLGCEGLVAQWDGGQVEQVPACYVESREIVNTSGAGDTVAGVFYAGMLQRASCRETLQRATELSSRVLMRADSRIIA